MRLSVGHRVPCTRSEGPHRRYALWVRGCTLRCPGCCNPELFERGADDGAPVADLVAEIAEAATRLDLEGITLLGGEPLEQLPAVNALCEALATTRPRLGVIVFTGYPLARARALSGFDVLWRRVDTVVDGPFDARQAESLAGSTPRRFIGSRNQRLHHRTARYADPALWRGANAAELQIAPDGTLSVHGFPDEVVALRRALTRTRRQP